MIVPDWDDRVRDMRACIKCADERVRFGAACGRDARIALYAEAIQEINYAMDALDSMHRMLADDVEGMEHRRAQEQRQHMLQMAYTKTYEAEKRSEEEEAYITSEREQTRDHEKSLEEEAMEEQKFGGPELGMRVEDMEPDLGDDQ